MKPKFLKLHYSDPTSYVQKYLLVTVFMQRLSIIAVCVLRKSVAKPLRAL